jgi:hypothetical protein
MIDGSRARGNVLLLPWAAYRRPAWNGDRALLDPWPRLLSRQVIWNDGAQVGRTALQPDDPAARRLNRVITGAGPLTSALRAAGVRFVIVDSGGGMAVRLPGCTVIAARPGLVVYQVPGSPGLRAPENHKATRTCYSPLNCPVTCYGLPVRHQSFSWPGRSVMITLLAAVAVGIAVAIGGAFAMTDAFSGVANGTPSHASLYQYGNR